MPVFYTWVILLINQSEEIGEKQLSGFGSRGVQISSLMRVALYTLNTSVSLNSSNNFAEDKDYSGLRRCTGS